MKPTPQLSDRLVVIVGASTGLGRATADRLAAAGHPVVTAGRELSALPAASRATLRVDLTALADVARFAGELAALTATHGKLATLICNAGVQTTRRRMTGDGHEETFAVNHLAHFATIMHLAAAHAFAPGARVIVIGSGTVDPHEKLATRLGFRGARFTTPRALAAGEGDAAVDEAQRCRDAYATSKLCNLLTLDALAARTRAITALAIDPGLMPGTGLARDRGLATRIAWQTIARLIPGSSSVARASAALAWLAVDPALAGATGRYVDFTRATLEAVRSRADADALYTESLALAGIVRDPFARVPGATTTS